MTNRVILYIMIAWSAKGYGQQSFFLDSLFSYDLSQIETMQLEEQRSEIERLRHDWGLAVGMNVTNSFQEEIDAGLSTRIFAKANLWGGGYYSNRAESEVIDQQIKLDSIQGIDRALDHNYGIFFDYVIYLYNMDRLASIDHILTDNARITTYFKNLYYNKLIDYSELLEVENIGMQFSLLMESQTTYNRLFEEALADTLLPSVATETHWSVDFAGLCELILQDSSDQEVIALQHHMLDLQYEKQTAPSLSAAVGYDVSRHRPYFAVNFAVDIRTHKKQNLAAQKLRVSNDVRLQEVQKKKEILNVQYEYRYKEKQLHDLYTKVRNLEEQQRKYEVRREVLSLTESIQEQKLALHLQMVRYEIIDLKGQLMLMLLRVKRILPTLEIGPYVKPTHTLPTTRKYAGNRFILQEEGERLTAFDTLFLQQNEIQVVSAAKLITMVGLIEVDPAEHHSRVEMEKAILASIDAGQGRDFLITDLDKLKDLELRTLAQKDFAITAYTD